MRKKTTAPVMTDRACCSSRRTLLQHHRETSRHCDKDTHVSLVKIKIKAGIERKHALPERDDTLLEPGTGRRLRAARYGENVRAGISPYPLCEQLPDPVVYARHGLVRIRKVRRNGVDGILILVDDGRVARVVPLEIKRGSGLFAGSWRLIGADDHGGEEIEM